MANLPGFNRFWSIWPKNSGRYTRKGAKSQCAARWEKYSCETQADQICKHVEWLKSTADWLKDGGAFIPAPLVYLNQQRWDGAEIPDAPSHISDFEKTQRWVIEHSETSEVTTDVKALMLKAKNAILRRVS